MTNPYLNQLGATANADGEFEKLPKFKLTNVGDALQGVILRQSPWRDDQYKSDNKVRYIDIRRTVDAATNKTEDVLYIIAKFDEKKKIGDALQAAGLADTEPGDIFGIKLIELRPTTKGNPQKIHQVVIKRP